MKVTFWFGVDEYIPKKVLEVAVVYMWQMAIVARSLCSFGFYGMPSVSCCSIKLGGLIRYLTTRFAWSQGNYCVVCWPDEPVMRQNHVDGSTVFGL